MLWIDDINARTFSAEGLYYWHQFIHNPIYAQDPPVERARGPLKLLESGSSPSGHSLGKSPVRFSAPPTSSGEECGPSLALRTYVAVVPRKDSYYLQILLYRRHISGIPVMTLSNHQCHC